MSRLDAITDWAELAKLAHYHAGELARRCLVSPSQLRKYFRQVFGASPQKWLAELRLCQAEERLCSGHSVKEVALQFGFFDEGHFCREFRKHRTCTPVEYMVNFHRSRQTEIDLQKEALGNDFNPALLPHPPWEMRKLKLCQRLGSAYFGHRSETRRMRVPSNKCAFYPMKTDCHRLARP